MRFPQLIVFAFVVSMSAAWATGSKAPLKTVPEGQEAGKALVQAREQQSKSRAEVKRLEHDVTIQQSDSDEAGKRLQQQDEAIAELRKQLHELKAQPPVGEH